LFVPDQGTVLLEGGDGDGKVGQHGKGLSRGWVGGADWPLQP
jgi:hypothetical protein